MTNVNITLSISEELHKKMKEHGEIRWSEVVRKIIEQKLADLELLDKLTGKSKLTEKEARELSEKINKAVAKKLGIL